MVNSLSNEIKTIINIKIDETYNLFKTRIEQFLILIKNISIFR